MEEKKKRCAKAERSAKYMNYVNCLLLQRYALWGIIFCSKDNYHGNCIVIKICIIGFVYCNKDIVGFVCYNKDNYLEFCLLQ